MFGSLLQACLSETDLEDISLCSVPLTLNLLYLRPLLVTHSIIFLMRIWVFLIHQNFLFCALSQQEPDL
ncbi:unnamed protein product, partial [Gulo gulo]